MAGYARLIPYCFKVFFRFEWLLFGKVYHFFFLYFFIEGLELAAFLALVLGIDLPEALVPLTILLPFFIIKLSLFMCLDARVIYCGRIMYVIYYEYLSDMPEKWSSGPSRFKRTVQNIEEARKMKKELEKSEKVQKVSIHKLR